MWSSSVLLTAALASCTLVSAHMELSKPYPIRSPLNPALNYNQVDYSYTSPLNADGSNFPCKGYHTDTPILYTASYVAGQSYNIALQGSATHGGGSCQISLSYDNGVTFKVIKSMMGGCPLVSTYDFTVPSFAPAGNALLAWTWFNKVGNREIYMNCAWVQIASSASKIRRERASRRDVATFNALPNIFIANIPQAQGVTTLEGSEVTFPVPGSVIAYGGSINSASSLGQGYTGVSQTNNGGSSGGGGGADVPSSPSSAPSSTTVVVIPSSMSVPIAVPPSPTVALPTPSSSIPGGVFVTIPVPPFQNTTVTISSAAPTVSATLIDPPSPVTTVIPLVSPPSAPSTTIPFSPSPPSTTPSPSTVPVCSPGALLCPSPSTYALCNADGSPTSPQPVAPGTQCSNGMIVLASSLGGCSAAPGVWLCTNGGQSFASCSNGVWVNMGSVAAGTICQNRAIVAA